MTRFYSRDCSLYDYSSRAMISVSGRDMNLPPSPLIAALSALVCLPLAAVGLQRSHRLTGEPRRFLVMVLAGTVLGALVTGGHVALRSPGVPYNIRELAGGHPTLSLIALSLALLASGGVPMAFAILWQKRPESFARLYGPLVAGVATVVFLVAWLVVPVESLDDIVGTPVLKLNDLLERWLRFVALFIGVVSGWTIGARLALNNLRTRPLLIGIAVTSAVMLMSYVVVVPLAATNNIYELLRGRGGVAAALGIAAYLIMLSAIFAALARSVVLARGRLAVVVPFLVLITSVPVAWQLFFCSQPIQA